MRFRAFVFAALPGGCLLSACSGGSTPPAPSPATAAPSATASAKPTATPTLPPSSPTPAPAATPSPALYPYANGNVFLYSGKLVQSYQSFPEAQPPGSPSPEPIATTDTNVSQRVDVATGGTFGGTSGLVDLHDAETDAQASGLQSTTSVTDAYVGTLATSATTSLLGYGSVYSDEAGDSISTIPSPATLLDQLPEIAGASWSNGPAGTIDEALAGNSTGSAITVVRTTNGDGTYGEKTTYPPNYSGAGITGVGTIQENADGSGYIAIEANGGPTTITYSAPEPQASGPPLITIDEYASLDTTGTPAATFQIPTWYGNAPALYAETDRDDGIVAVPPACDTAATMPRQATELAQSIARTDTILGYTETTDTTNYVAPGYGLVCTTLTDTQTLVYDFNGDEPFVYTATPPLEIATTTETLGLQAGSTIQASSRTRAIPATALRARFDRTVLATRASRLAALVRRIEARRMRGGLR